MEQVDILLVAATTGLVQALKQAGLPSRFAPLTAVALGIAGSFWLDTELLFGIIAGLAAVGLYATPTTTVAK